MNSSASKGFRRLTGEFTPVTPLTVVYATMLPYLGCKIRRTPAFRLGESRLCPLELLIGTAPNAKRGHALAARPRHRTSSRIALVTIAKISSEISGILCAVAR